jgi:very-short-patch-repair endonuclease
LRAARQARGNLTPAEALLWERLRNRQVGGFKFRRQQTLGSYIADFFCAEAKLVVELDGSIHRLRAEVDEARTRWLEEGGLAVFRFANQEVLSSPDQVVAKIVTACTQRLT